MPDHKRVLVGPVEGAPRRRRGAACARAGGDALGGVAVV